jgi:hypothetical protein
MELVHGRLERQHRRLGVQTHFLEPGADQFIVLEFNHGDPAQHRAVAQGRRIAGVGGEPFEGRKLAIGHHAEPIPQEDVVAGRIGRGSAHYSRLMAQIELT